MKWEDLKIEVYTGKAISEHISEVAEFRIRYFHDFPYLYAGNLEYESEYLAGYAKDPASILVKIRDEGGKLLGVSTGLPLATDADILEGAVEMFTGAGLVPKDYYYYGEIILDYSIRRRGFSRRVYSLQDAFAQARGFSKVAIATVVRDAGDPRRPADMADADIVWKGLGFAKTGIEFEYHWPTLESDGTVVDRLNPMVYWTRELT